MRSYHSLAMKIAFVNCFLAKIVCSSIWSIEWLVVKRKSCAFKSGWFFCLFHISLDSEVSIRIIRRNWSKWVYAFRRLKSFWMGLSRCCSWIGAFSSSGGPRRWNSCTRFVIRISIWKIRFLLIPQSAFCYWLLTRNWSGFNVRHKI